MSDNILKMVLPLPISQNHYLKHRVSRGKRKFVQTYKTQEALYFENKARPVIQREVINQQWKIPDREIYIKVDVVWYLHKKGVDCSNMFKQLLDVMQNIVYINDSMVLESSSNCYIDTNNPRCELTIYLSDKMGIFDNKEHKKTFTDKNCSVCTKKKSSCSIMKKMLENRIIPETDLETNICYKIKIKKSKDKSNIKILEAV